MRALKTLPVISALAVGVLAGAGPASADVTAVKGSAYGYFASVSLFGGPAMTAGPAPTVTLPASGSAIPITASAMTGMVQFGPAILFSSGPITVSTTGTLGPAGSVASSTSITSINTSGNEVFTATSATSSCTASETTRTGTTTITNGTLQTSEGNPDVTGDETVVMIPTNPAPNTTYNGTLESVGDSFQYIFNEQIVNPDGSLTVYAAHLRLIGPTAVGNLYIGKSECGVTPPSPTAATFRSLEALAARNGVLVRWRTASEIDTLGFHVYRSVTGGRVRLNARLITAKGRGSYSFLDRKAPRVKKVRYWLQVVNVDGSRSWYGPASETPRP